MIFDTCGHMYMTLFITKRYDVWLLCQWFCWEALCKVTGWQNKDVIKDVTKQPKDTAKLKNKENNWRFEDHVDTKIDNVDKNLTSQINRG